MQRLSSGDLRRLGWLSWELSQGREQQGDRARRSALAGGRVLGVCRRSLERYGDSTNAPGAFVPQQLSHASPVTPCVYLLSRASTSFHTERSQGEVWGPSPACPFTPWE